MFKSKSIEINHKLFLNIAFFEIRTAFLVVIVRMKFKFL